MTVLNQANPTLATASCPKCSAAAPTGALFCGSCGASMSGTAAGPQAAPPPPPPPQAPISPMRFQSGAGPEAESAVELDEAEAFNQALAGVQQAGGQVLWQSPPNAAKFQVTKGSLMLSSGFKVTFAGDLSVTRAGPRQSVVRVAVKLNWNSFVPVAICGVVAAVVLMFMSPMQTMLWFVLSAACVGYGAWHLSSKTPQEIAARVLGQRPGTSPFGSAPFAMRSPLAGGMFGARPAAPATAPAVPQAAPPAAAPASEDVLGQIKRLAELRDLGALTPEEFEAKKADLLSRL